MEGGQEGRPGFAEENPFTELGLGSGRGVEEGRRPAWERKGWASPQTGCRGEAPGRGESEVAGVDPSYSE